MEYAASRMQDIYLHLKKKGFDVYFPAQKLGECTKPYVVVKDATTSKVAGISSTITYYDVLCYVPGNQFSTLDPFVDSVDKAMAELQPMIRPTYVRTQSFYDQAIEAHMISIQYKNYRKIV